MTFKFSVWQHFGFYKGELGKLDKSHTVGCVTLQTNIVGRNHITRQHPELDEWTENPQIVCNQKTIPNLKTMRQAQLVRTRRITKCIITFIAKDSGPFSVAEDAGLHRWPDASPRLELLFQINSSLHFT